MSRRDWYRDLQPASDEHPVDVEIQTRLKGDPDYQELHAQVLELGGMLGQLLDGEMLLLWLRIEAAINDRWAAFAEEAYNVGVDAGLATCVVDDVLADAGVDARLKPAAAIRALAVALARVSERLR